MNLSTKHSVYFLGIGGIGMSSLARWFLANGYKVFGYDKTATPLTQQLEQEGMSISYIDEVGAVEEHLVQNQNDYLLVYTPAIPADSVLKNFFLAKGVELYKRSEVLGFITKNHFTMAVAGTHGKTSTSSMLAHVLHQAGVNCTAFLGGIASNYDSNLILSAKEENQIVVVEADEFDRSFLTLSPNIAIITTNDPDHLDIYHDEKSFHLAFQQFTEKIQEGGVLIKSHLVSSELGQALSLKKITYGEGQTVFSEMVSVRNGFSCFTYHGREKIEGFELALPGEHNVRNATAVITACLEFGLTPQQIVNGINTFKGVKRRFEYVFKSDKCVYIDDYAHHPVEISNCLQSVKKMFPERKLLIVFQPHLFSRTQDFMDAFAESLAIADELVLLDIYPARELPIAGVTSQVLLQKVSLTQKQLLTKQALVHYIETQTEANLIMTMGAGDISDLVHPIKAKLEVKYA